MGASSGVGRLFKTNTSEFGESREQGSRHDVCAEGALPPGLVTVMTRVKKGSAIEFTRLIRMRIPNRNVCAWNVLK